MLPVTSLEVTFHNSILKKTSVETFFSLLCSATHYLTSICTDFPIFMKFARILANYRRRNLSE